MRRRDLLVLAAPSLLSGETGTLKEADNRSFDSYCGDVEAGLKEGFRLSSLPQHRQLLDRGQVAVSPMVNPNPRRTGDCFIHDWAAAAVAPQAKAARILEVLRDFNRHKQIYSPDVEDSRLIRQEGDVYRSFLRFRKKKFITVVLNCEYETRFRAEDRRGASLVRSVRIVEVDKPGTPNETEKPVGGGFGFLYRMNSYWQWEERPEGLLMELRSVSLSRDVPAAVAWAVNSLITSMPRESLIFTLERTRQALR